MIWKSTVTAPRSNGHGATALQTQSRDSVSFTLATVRTTLQSVVFTPQERRGCMLYPSPATQTHGPTHVSAGLSVCTVATLSERPAVFPTAHHLFLPHSPCGAMFVRKASRALSTSCVRCVDATELNPAAVRSRSRVGVDDASEALRHQRGGRAAGSHLAILAVVHARPVPIPIKVVLPVLKPPIANLHAL